MELFISVTLKGLDAASYKLSLRAYAGPRRFLEDTLRGRDWFSYRVRMPGGEKGYSELLKVVLALGDGVASDTIWGGPSAPLRRPLQPIQWSRLFGITQVFEDLKFRLQQR